MPVVNFHLVEGHFTEAQAKDLLLEAAKLYGTVLDSPMERIRAFITSHSPQHFVVGGDLVAANDVHAPYFEFVVLEGRPLEHRRALMKGFAELLANVLNVDLKLVRGMCRRVDPDEWTIGDTPASVLRAAEIKARGESQR